MFNFLKSKNIENLQIKELQSQVDQLKKDLFRLKHEMQGDIAYCVGETGKFNTILKRKEKYKFIAPNEENVANTRNELAEKGYKYIGQYTATHRNPIYGALTTEMEIWVKD